MMSITVSHLRATHLGFRIDNLLLVRADFERLPQKGPDLVHLYRRMIERIKQMSGVDKASVAVSTPLHGMGQTGVFTSASTSKPAIDFTDRYWVNDVGAGYFATLGTRLLAGREFSGEDTDANTCILNHAAAQRLFPGSVAVGETVRQSNRSMNSGQTSTRDCQVIGIVEDAKYTSLREPAPPTVYLPFGLNTDRLASMYFVIHAATLVEAADAWRRVHHELAPASPETEPISFAVQFDDSIARERLLSVLSGFFAALALLLSGIGIYGLMASYVTRRTTEIGVRMALGATRGRIVRLIMRQVAALLLLGSIAGGCLAAFAARSVKVFLFDVNPGSPAIFASAVFILLAAGFTAAVLPAVRAVSIDPTQALRSE
jgi:predicted permease